MSASDKSMRPSVADEDARAEDVKPDVPEHDDSDPPAPSPSSELGSAGPARPKAGASRKPATAAGARRASSATAGSAVKPSVAAKKRGVAKKPTVAAKKPGAANKPTVAAKRPGSANRPNVAAKKPDAANKPNVVAKKPGAAKKQPAGTEKTPGAAKEPPPGAVKKPSSAAAKQPPAGAAKKPPAEAAKKPPAKAKAKAAAAGQAPRSKLTSAPLDAPAVAEDRDSTTDPGDASEPSNRAPEPGDTGEAVEPPVAGDAAVADGLLTQGPSSRVFDRRTRRSMGRRSAINGRVVPPARRAELAAAAAAIAARDAKSPPAATTPAEGTRVRLVALAVIVLLAGAMLSVFLSRSPATTLSSSDARFMTGQLLAADDRVRSQLATLRPQDLSEARARTRGALATTRSLAVQMRAKDGDAAERVRRALALERDWLDAVGSTLANPRSPLREQIVRRDRELRAALAALPGDGVARSGASQRLVDYALAREGANSAG